MDKNSRSFKIYTLALNKKQQQKIANYKRTLTKRRRTNEDIDYVPSSSSSEASESEVQNESSEIKEADVASTSQHTNATNYLNLPVEIIKEILSDIVCDVVDKSEYRKTFTKKGEFRKRRKFNSSVTERKRSKLQNVRKRHMIKAPCNEKCRSKCRQKIDQGRRVDINREYWKLENKEQKNFMLNHTSQMDTKRRTVAGGLKSRRSKTFIYSLKDKNGSKQEVCKVFFLATLGYEKKNDRVLRSALSKTEIAGVSVKSNMRGKQKNFKFDRNIIVQHINSFNPTIAHYRREHAPDRKYLPSDLNITLMYNNFKEKHPEIQFSYYLYREVVSSLNISFVKLGHEECWACEVFHLHQNNNPDHRKDNFNEECDECKKFLTHRVKYTNARQEYTKDSNGTQNPLVFSADLQKVIMLPRLEMYKEVIFTPRLIAFNESFVPAGKKPKGGPVAVIWHEATSGRSKRDLISSFYAFFQTIRDAKNVVLWLDNCTSQNKNWCLFTFFVYLVNSEEVGLETLQIKYFEPGHTFMGADSFHHQVEKSLKNMGKVYDFHDFTNAVRNASAKVNIVTLNVSNFFLWQDGTSQYKLNKIVPRPYLHEMVQIDFHRGAKTFCYKKSFEEANGQTVNFLTAAKMKEGLVKPKPKLTPRGITEERKNLIVSKLGSIMSLRHLQFWQELPTTSNGQQNNSDEDE